MQTLTPYDEIQTLLLIVQGDQKAFTKLVDIYWSTVYNHALAYSKSTQVAQEITQDIFLKVWNKKENLREIENFKGYLFILGRNQIISTMRKKLQENVEADFINLPEKVWLPDHQICYKEMNQEILNAIEKLPPVRKKVFKMSRFEGLTYQEIAINLQISKNTVKDHIAIALIFLKTHLQTYRVFLPWIFLSLYIF